MDDLFYFVINDEYSVVCDIVWYDVCLKYIKINYQSTDRWTKYLTPVIVNVLNGKLGCKRLVFFFKLL